jgi:uncharacterized membrane protein YdjX (TVP38/TMEM64 family)
VAAEYENWLHDLIALHLILAVVAYIVIYIGLMTLIWVPAWPCTLIGGFLFGRWLGFASALLGATGGAITVFLLARAGLSTFVSRAGPAVDRLNHSIRRNAFSYIVALRLVPVIPFALISTAAALLKVRLRSFATATLLGIVPSTLIYASLGVTLGDISAEDTASGAGVLLRSNILLPLIGLAMLALVPVGCHWTRARRVSSVADD